MSLANLLELLNYLDSVSRLVKKEQVLLTKGIALSLVRVWVPTSTKESVMKTAKRQVQSSLRENAITRAKT